MNKSLTYCPATLELPNLAIATQTGVSKFKPLTWLTFGASLAFRFIICLLLLADSWLYVKTPVLATPASQLPTVSKPPLIVPLLQPLSEAPFVADFHLPPSQSGTMMPVYTRVPTTQPVIFLTIDDGVFKPQDAADYIKQNHLPVSLFLNDKVINNNYSYFSGLLEEGAEIENHTFNHPHLKTLTFEQQKNEICGDNDALNRAYSIQPTLFRPPYGQYNDNTRKAAQACGLKALVLWSVVTEHGQLRYQKPGGGLGSGDIVLMHFKADLLEDIKAVEATAKQANLQIELLEDWLK